MNQTRFSTIYNLHYEDFLLFAQKNLHNPSLAEDCVQETFLQFIEREQTSISHYRTTSLKELFLHQIEIFNQNNNTYLPYEEDFLETSTLASDDSAIASYFSQCYAKSLTPNFLEEKLKTLPPKEQEPLRLFFLYNLSTREISNRLVISETAVRKRMERGRKRLFA